ncbi:MAG: cbb3-type cytochrome oxidase assembly protein CcoS [Chitinophagia bacterium]|nr:cbb3-type cytochrome oxidase assembly protein CcoS [Chitinophagia bacterium]
MSVIIILILASLLVASGFLLAFIWSVRKGQFEDEVSPSVRMLFEDKTFSDSSSTRQKP